MENITLKERQVRLHSCTYILRNGEGNNYKVTMKMEVRGILGQNKDQ